MVHIRLATEVPAPVESVFDLARDIDLHTRSLAHSGEQAVGGRTVSLGTGETVTWHAGCLGLNWSLTSLITACEPPARFVDEQVSGPFAWVRHEHRFEPILGRDSNDGRLAARRSVRHQSARLSTRSSAGG